MNNPTPNLRHPLLFRLDAGKDRGDGAAGAEEDTGEAELTWEKEPRVFFSICWEAPHRFAAAAPPPSCSVSSQQRPQALALPPRWPPLPPAVWASAQHSCIQMCSPGGGVSVGFELRRAHWEPSCLHRRPRSGLGSPAGRRSRVAGRPGGPPGREGRVRHPQSSACALPQRQKGGRQCEERPTVCHSDLSPS